MPVAVVLEFEGATLDRYDQVVDKMGFQPGGAGAPGGLFHWVTETPNGFRVTDVWETREQFEAFADAQIGPIARRRESRARRRWSPTRSTTTSRPVSEPTPVQVGRAYARIGRRVHITQRPARWACQFAARIRSCRTGDLDSTLDISTARDHGGEAWPTFSVSSMPIRSTAIRRRTPDEVPRIERYHDGQATPTAEGDRLHARGAARMRVRGIRPSQVPRGSGPHSGRHLRQGRDGLRGRAASSPRPTSSSPSRSGRPT